MVQRLRPEMLSDVAKIKGGNRDTSPAPAVMWWGNLAYQVEGKLLPELGHTIINCDLSKEAYNQATES